MIFTSPYTTPIPSLDILTFLFTRRVIPPSTPLWLDAADPSHHITAGHAETLTRRIGHALRHHFSIGAAGPPANPDHDADIVITFVENQTLIAPTVFGILCAGGVHATCPPTATAFELARQIRGSAPKVLICSPLTRAVAEDALEKVRAAEPDAVIPALLIMKSTNPVDILRPSGASILTPAELPWERITSPTTLASRTTCLVYSSGTTGPPKGVRLSHANLVANVCQIAFHLSPLTTSLLSTPSSPPPAMPGIIPNAHAGGLMIHTYLPLAVGMRVYLLPRYSLPTLVSLIRAHQLTLVFGVPAIWAGLAAADDVRPADLASVRFAMSGAAPLPRAVREAAGRKLREGVRVSTNWGMTEVVCEGAQFALDEVDEEGAVGRLMPGMQARVLALEDGRELGVGEEGELVVRGPNVTLGYHHAPAATAATIRDGWLHTGDIARFSAAGKLFIVGRSKELIKYNGTQIAPSDLEATLLEHPAVRDAGVVGVPAANDNELPRAYVVRREGEGVQEGEIEGWVRERVSPFKRLRGGVVFVDAIPRNPSGKILRGLLKEWVVKGEGRARL